MAYEPREGVDYVINLYALAGVEAQTEPDELKRAINQRMVEYHPDRLQGLAPEFRTKGERMAQLLNRARVILLDPAKRQEYDEVLSDWEGPISTDGTPVIRADRYLQAEMEGKSTDEIEEIFTKQADQVSSMTGYSPSRLSFLEKMMARAGDDVPDDLRAEYEDALLSHDRSLAIQEAERSRLLSLPDIGKSGYAATLDYSETIAGEIETAREVRHEQARMLALGGVGTRLALLAGEDAQPSEAVVLASDSSYTLPAYFEQQAEKIKEIAAAREELVKKRLANFQPTYPETELQTEAKPNLAIGIGVDSFTWFGVAIDNEAGSANMNAIPDEIKALLDDKQYETAISSGYNVLTFAPLEQIDVQTLLLEAIEKHAQKYDIGSEE